MRSLRDFKIPDFKFPKMKMEGMENIGEVEVDYAKVEEAKEKKKNKKNYPGTDYQTIKEVFLEATEKFADKEFILEKPDHKTPYREYTFKEFRDDVLSFGTGLEEKLNLKNERIAIIGETTYEWYVSYIALLCGSGITVPIDKELPANELINVLERSRAGAVIYTAKKKEEIKKIKDSVPFVKYFIEINSEEELNGRDIGFENVKQSGKKMLEEGNKNYLNIEIDPNEFKLLIFTSGTTSSSKGVMICNRNLAYNINAVAPYVKIYPEDRFFSVLPLHHTYESTIGFLLPLAKGSSVAICEGLKYIVPNLKESKPTCILAVPLLIENIYKKINATIDKSGKTGLVNSMIHVTNALKSVGVDIKKKVFKEIYDNIGGNVRIMVSAAAPIDAKVGKWLQDIGITFLQGYGLTETAPIAALTPDFDARVGSAGKAVVCDEIKLHNPNENGEGEVWIKGKTVMLGYYEDEEATNDVMHDGWFNSGDIGYMDKDGFLYITGRSKNVIVTQNGKNIYPEEIEIMLGKIDEISECMVYGKEVEGQKELIISVKVIPNYEKIEEKHGKDLTEDQIREIIWNEIKNVNKQLTSYKAIKNLEIKKDEFEKTTTMKIKRYAEIKKDKEKQEKQ